MQRHTGKCYNKHFVKWTDRLIMLLRLTDVVWSETDFLTFNNSDENKI